MSFIIPKLELTSGVVYKHKRITIIYDAFSYKIIPPAYWESKFLTYRNSQKVKRKLGGSVYIKRSIIFIDNVFKPITVFIQIPTYNIKIYDSPFFGFNTYWALFQRI